MTKYTHIDINQIAIDNIIEALYEIVLIIYRVLSFIDKSTKHG
jgi:hypothetical protein